MPSRICNDHMRSNACRVAGLAGSCTDFKYRLHIQFGNISDPALPRSDDSAWESRKPAESATERVCRGGGTGCILGLFILLTAAAAVRAGRWENALGRGFVDVFVLAFARRGALRREALKGTGSAAQDRPELTLCMRTCTTTALTQPARQPALRIGSTSRPPIRTAQ